MYPGWGDFGAGRFSHLCGNTFRRGGGVEGAGRWRRVVAQQSAEAEFEGHRQNRGREATLDADDTRGEEVVVRREKEGRYSIRGRQGGGREQGTEVGLSVSGAQVQAAGTAYGDRVLVIPRGGC